MSRAWVHISERGVTPDASFFKQSIAEQGIWVLLQLQEITGTRTVINIFIV